MKISMFSMSEVFALNSKCRKTSTNNTVDVELYLVLPSFIFMITLKLSQGTLTWVLKYLTAVLRSQQVLKQKYIFTKTSNKLH